MIDMVERVARAIWNIRREDEDRCDMELEDMGPIHPVWAEARAAINAMREPTTEMAMAAEFSSISTSQGGDDSFDYVSQQDAANIFRTMIDAALKPQ